MFGDIDKVFAFAFLFDDLNRMEYIGGEYLIKIFNDDESLNEMVKFVSLHVLKEHDGISCA